MILYSVTVNIDDNVHDEWFHWMKHKHIPDVIGTGLFLSYRMFKVLTTQAGETGTTYCVQYFLETIENYRDYLQNYAPALQTEYNERYKDKYAAFRTLLEEV